MPNLQCLSVVTVIDTEVRDDFALFELISLQKCSAMLIWYAISTFVIVGHVLIIICVTLIDCSHASLVTVHA